MQLPELQAIYKKYQKRGFEVVAVSVDQNEHEQTLKAMIVSKKISWANVANLIGDSPPKSEPNVKRYHVPYYPMSMLIDQKGNLITYGAHGKRLEQLLDELLPGKKE